MDGSNIVVTSARRRFDQWNTGDEARGDFHLRRRDHLLGTARDARNAAAHQLCRSQTTDDGKLEGIGADGSSNHWDLSCFREGWSLDVAAGSAKRSL
jgi:hypothetical protein